MSTEPHVRLNALPEPDARAALACCCGAGRWVEGMLARRPFVSSAALFASADELWRALDEDEQLQAFAHHPRIGADLASLRARFASTATLSTAEQAGVAGASDATLELLRAGNLAYEARFGFVFLVCATGRSAEEMLSALAARLGNTRQQELAIAAAEQAKITRLRLEKLT